MPCIRLVKCLRLNDLSGPGRIRSACKHTVASVSLPVPPDRPDARRSADLAAGSPVSQAFLILPENEIPLYVYGGQRRAKFGITHSLHEHGEGGLSLYRIGLAPPHPLRRESNRIRRPHGPVNFIHPEWAAHARHGRRRAPVDLGPARRPGTDRHQVRLRFRSVWRLHGARRPGARPILFHLDQGFVFT